MSSTRLCDICEIGATPGYILDEAEKYSISKIDELIRYVIRTLEKLQSERHLVAFYFGKSSLDYGEKTLLES